MLVFVVNLWPSSASQRELGGQRHFLLSTLFQGYVRFASEEMVEKIVQHPLEKFNFTLAKLTGTAMFQNLFNDMVTVERVLSMLLTVLFSL